jgi:hypothetical protein
MLDHCQSSVVLHFFNADVVQGRYIINLLISESVEALGAKSLFGLQAPPQEAHSVPRNVGVELLFCCTSSPILELACHPGEDPLVH